MNPPLNVAKSRQRWLKGTDMGPRTGAAGGSYRPGYQATAVRVWSNQAAYATIRG